VYNSATIERIKKMIFGSVYPLYLAKVEKKGRTKEELDQRLRFIPMLHSLLVLFAVTA
jgi:hypothetical protein